jgi:hypothetical protein
MKKLLEKIIIIFVETKCFKLVTKRLLLMHILEKNPISEMFLQGKKIHVSPYTMYIAQAC